MTDDEMRYVASTLPEIPAPPGWAWTPWMFWSEYQTYDGSRLVVRELWPITRDQKLRAGYRDRAEITELDLERNPGPAARR